MNENLDPIETTRRTYDQVAEQYAALNARMPDAVATQAVRLITRIRPSERILDLGCGPGRDLAWFEAHRVYAIGVDLSAGMLAEARRASKSSLCQMDMRCLGYADGCFAGVWCDAALLHLPKKYVSQALAEVKRILSPGGSFFLCVQKGDGEGVENSPASGNAPRFFAALALQRWPNY